MIRKAYVMAVHPLTVRRGGVFFFGKRGGVFYNMEQVKVWLEKYTSIKSLKTS